MARGTDGEGAVLCEEDGEPLSPHHSFAASFACVAYFSFALGTVFLSVRAYVFRVCVCLLCVCLWGVCVSLVSDEIIRRS